MVPTQAIMGSYSAATKVSSSLLGYLNKFSFFRKKRGALLLGFSLSLFFAFSFLCLSERQIEPEAFREGNGRGGEERDTTWASSNQICTVWLLSLKLHKCHFREDLVRTQVC